MAYFTEESILNSVKKMLSGRVNELLEEIEYHCQQVKKRGQQGLVPLLPSPQQFDL
jgi:hypothetical protein